MQGLNPNSISDSAFYVGFNEEFMQFKSLPLLYNAAGNVRTVGFELEFSNLGISESVQLIQRLYGGEVQADSRFCQRVTGTVLGDFTVEFDLTLLSERNYKKIFDRLHINLEDYKTDSGTLENEVETLLESVVGKLFPYEIATPPIPFTEIEQLEKLRQALYEHDARGTQDFLTNAFGTHINIEVPDTETETIVNYLKAMLLLYPWLLQVGQTDLARRVSPFIDPYPAAYAALVLSSDYKPELDILIAHYHMFNPNRNRPLDLYPLFAALKPETLKNYSELGKVKPRKTFHYRLPNSSISEPGWSLAQEWNNWVTIEVLANDRDSLSRLSKSYLELRERTIIGFESKWIKRIEQWLT